MDFKKIIKQTLKVLIPVLLSVSLVFVILYYRTSITRFISERGFHNVSEFIEEPFSKIEQEAEAQKKAEAKKCVTDFKLEDIPANKRQVQELSQYALCRAQVLKSRKECDVLSGQNKDVCEGDVNDFVFVTSLSKLFLEDARKDLSCGADVIMDCNNMMTDLSSQEFIISDNARNKFCVDICQGFKSKNASSIASVVHETFSRKTPTDTPSESLEKTKRDISALINFDASKCDSSVGEGLDCRNEVNYLSAWNFKDKSFCDKMVDVGGVMKDVFKGVCFAQFEQNEVGYCDRYLEDFKYNYCTETYLLK